jgi:ribosome-binding factor A
VLRYKRSERVADLLRCEVSTIIEHDLKDPRIGFVTVTAVRVTDDLKQARVLVTMLGDEEAREKSLQALQHASKHIRQLLGRRVRLKYIPQLKFAYDDTADAGRRIDRLLEGIRGEDGAS